MDIRTAGRYLAAMITSIGVAGEAFLLRHELVGGYPFKMLSYPSAGFCALFGNAAVPVGMAIFLVLGLRALRKQWSLAPPLLCAAAPLALGVLFLLCVRIGYPGPVPADRQNYDDITVLMVQLCFLRDTLKLGMAGFVVGGAFAIPLHLVLRRTKDLRPSEN